MAEDKFGDIWITTGLGVVKYNGETFTHFTEKEGLPGNHVQSILKDKYGNLWFGVSGSGVCKYDGRNFDPAS